MGQADYEKLLASSEAVKAEMTGEIRFLKEQQLALSQDKEKLKDQIERLSQALQQNSTESGDKEEELANKVSRLN